MLYDDEQRSFRRMMVEANATLEIDTGSEVLKVDALCKDLSANGMQLYVEEAVDPGVCITVHIQSATGSVPPLKALTRVVRCSQEDDGQYCVGVEMVDVN
ncbi:PilZ domain-containing protein [Pseudoalteromonas sp. SSDWG2]|uniref:PilZ domain-containing protein n=1 Tax=Pseudoalteromonas sp. SSDWG2 TaxID=3139391 RepID=UPI003BAAF363